MHAAEVAEENEYGDEQEDNGGEYDKALGGC